MKSLLLFLLFADINFQQIAERAIGFSHIICRSVLPNGKARANEWVALNPTRADRKLGSFRINLKTGKWADFATGDKGGDLISLVAYCTNSSQLESAKAIQNIIGR